MSIIDVNISLYDYKEVRVCRKTDFANFRFSKSFYFSKAINFQYLNLSNERVKNWIKKYGIFLYSRYFNLLTED